MTGELPLAGLRLRRGGHNNEQIFFEHPDHQGWSIYSSDPALLNDPGLHSRPDFVPVLRAVERARKAPPPTVYLAMAFVTLLLGGVVVFWLVKDHVVNFIADKIPISWEQKFGDQTFGEIAAQGKVLTNSPWRPTVQGITERLLPVVRNSGYDFRFHILQDTNVNAFAIPGGHVVILTGLLEAADSAEEVAGVLAHELAHVTRRHSLRNMVKSAGLLVIIQAAFGDVSGLLAVAAEGSRYLLGQKFSRDFEREADDTGWNYLVEAKIDPRGMIRFFEKMKQLMTSSGMGAMEGSLALLNTHPASQERIDRLTAKWEASQSKTDYTPLPPLKRLR